MGKETTDPEEIMDYHKDHDPNVCQLALVRKVCHEIIGAYIAEVQPEFNPDEIAHKMGLTDENAGKQVVTIITTLLYFSVIMREAAGSVRQGASIYWRFRAVWSLV